ncbi:MAG: serine/threonine-protein kinase [Pyrinomonadaceae bacterium]
MNSGNVVGQTLDGKYKIERELGRGGMGTVYLATHVGTERPVAVKVIAPQFMEHLEFVERFRREARAAGRLRHPNVVDVTDFGFSKTNDGNVAYLVMEYLDGCTLGEILEEEKKLPLGWSIDILEQVCSAVHEAHEQGIIHRDLKPDNIWLEPNQRGGYTVKVLDFGIAKLEEAHITGFGENVSLPTTPTQAINKNTFAGENQTRTIADNKHSTALFEGITLAQTVNDQTISNKQTLSSEAGTLIQTANEVDSESGTAILPVSDSQTAPKNVGTNLISKQIETGESAPGNVSTAGLTRVGAVLGTPLYMSPEQCRGEKLTKQSDIYSLGVIAYQMLSGKTPFSGDYLKVMEAHKETAPPPLEVKKVPKKVKKVVNSALAKNIADRPQTALAFASEIRARSEGVGTLFRRALEIYSKHLPKFLGLSVLFYLPVIVVIILKLAADIFYVGEQISDSADTILSVVLALANLFVGIFCGSFISGTTTWIVAQTLAVPLRPVRLRPALEATRKKWKSLVGTGLLTGTLTIIGIALCFLPGMILSVLWALVAPVVMMENLRGRAAMKRSKLLVKRSLRTTTAAILLMLFVPILVGLITGGIVAMSVETFSGDRIKTKTINREVTKAQNEGRPLITIENENGERKIVIGSERLDADEQSAANTFSKHLREVINRDAGSILILPFQILISSLWSIIIALLYLKTRQEGGESMQDLLAQFQASDQTHSNWRKHIRERLEQSGKLTSKS